VIDPDTGGCATLCHARRSPSSCASAAVVAEAVPSRAESLVRSSREEFQASETDRQSLRKRTDCRSLRVLQPWANSCCALRSIDRHVEGE
jgi:hypothetical protein